MSYYKRHREAILEYQKNYNIIHKDTIKEYQRDYFQRNRVHIVKENKISYERKRVNKPLPKYKIDALERMLRRKIKDYNDSLEQIEIHKAIVNDKRGDPLTGFTMRNSSFILHFE